MKRLHYRIDRKQFTNIVQLLNDSAKTGADKDYLRYDRTGAVIAYINSEYGLNGIVTDLHVG